MMTGSGAPWQLECEKLEQRCGYLLTSGVWSDCTFVVGSGLDTVPAHKLVLAMTSPIFAAMFYEGPERNDPIVIPDVEPEPFRALLEYIYTGNIDIGSFDMACDLFYVAKKYMLPHLVNKCKGYISRFAGPSNSCRVQELARLFDEKMVMDKGVQDAVKAAANIVHVTRPNDQQVLDKGVLVLEAQEPPLTAGNDKLPSESKSIKLSTSRSEIVPRVNRLPSSAPAMSTAGLYQKYSPINYVPLTQRLHLQQDTAKAAANIVHVTRPNVQQALDKGVLESQKPPLTVENDKLPSESKSIKLSTSRSEIVPRVNRLPSSAPAMSTAGLYQKYSPINYVPLTQRLHLQQDTAKAAANIVHVTRPNVQQALDKGVLESQKPPLTVENDKLPSESKSIKLSTSRSEIVPRVNRLPSSAPAMSTAGLYQKYSPINYVPLTQRLHLQQDTAKAAANIVHVTRPNVQQALDKGVLESQKPPLTVENDKLPSESKSIKPSTSRIKIVPRVNRLPSSAPAMSTAGLYQKYSPINYVPLTQRLQLQKPEQLEQCFKPGSLEHTINALKCGTPSEVKEAVAVARNMLYKPATIQPALEKGILDALVPLLVRTKGDDKCTNCAVVAICNLCGHGSSSQLAVLAASDALQPFSQLLFDGATCDNVLRGLYDLLMKVEKNTKPDLIMKLRKMGIPQRMISLKQDSDEECCKIIDYILPTYFGDTVSNMCMLKERDQDMTATSVRLQ